MTSYPRHTITNGSEKIRKSWKVLKKITEKWPAVTIVNGSALFVTNHTQTQNGLMLCATSETFQEHLLRERTDVSRGGGGGTKKLAKDLFVVRHSRQCHRTLTFFALVAFTLLTFTFTLIAFTFLLIFFLFVFAFLFTFGFLLTLFLIAFFLLFRL